MPAKTTTPWPTGSQVHLPTLLIATKADRIPTLADEWAVFQELTGWCYPMLALTRCPPSCSRP